MIPRYLHAVIQLHRHKLLLLPAFEIHAIDGPVQKEIEIPFFPEIKQFSHLSLQIGIRFIPWKECFLLHDIDISVISADPNAYLPLMISAIHITINGKINISLVIHLQDLNVVFIVFVSDIHDIIIIKLEYPDQFLSVSLICIKTICLLEGQYGTTLIFCHGHVFIRNAEQDLVTAIEPVILRNLRHGPLIIQQIHSVRRKSHAEIFPHPILILVRSILHRHLIIRHKAPRLTV